MPYTVNGIGTTTCPGRGLISWVKAGWWGRQGTHDYDGILAVCVFYLPIIPYGALHVYNRVSAGMGEQYNQMAIKWSLGLVIRAFLRRWAVAGLFIGPILAIPVFIELSNRRWASAIGFAFFSFLFTVASVVIWMILDFTDRRNVNLRRVMASTGFGSSDPVTWTQPSLQLIHPPERLFGADSFAAAAEKAFDAGEFGRAMLAARFWAALEDRAEGERFTDDILADPEVIDALPKVHADPNVWKEYFGKGYEDPKPSQPPPLDEEDLEDEPKPKRKATDFSEKPIKDRT